MLALTLENDCLKVRQYEKPTPGPREAMIQVLVTGLCRTDIYVAEGKLPVKTPLILGHEFSGRVVKLGPGCENVQLNDLVACDPRLEAGFMGFESNGSFAEYVTVPESNLICLPLDMSAKKAALLEPVAACLAPQKWLENKKAAGVIYGRGRIAVITERLMRVNGFSSFQLADTLADREDNSLNWIIVTHSAQAKFDNIFRVLRPHGTLIIKDRPTEPISLDPRNITLKELTIQGAAYDDFHVAAHLLPRVKLADLFGPTFSLEQYDKAITIARQEPNLKVFFQCAA